LVLLNVTIISREFPICYIWMKNKHKEEKRPGSVLEI
jgi:hypothetical protein